jgi:hypothetical protein
MRKTKAQIANDARAASRREIAHRLWYLGRLTPVLNDVDLSAVEHGLALLIADLTMTENERAKQFGYAKESGK